jgi:hypothetical protein
MRPSSEELYIPLLFIIFTNYFLWALDEIYANL